jgi:hypothetical protein
MQRTTMFLLGALLATGVVVAVWLAWFSPRGYTVPVGPGGLMSVGEKDETTVQYVCRGGGMLVVVWSDQSGKAAHSETGSSTTFAGSSGRTEWHSSVKARDGSAVQLNCATTDGKTWTVAVNGKEYRLEDGAVFLIRTRGGPAKVSQVKQDLSGLQPTKETWERLAKENPEVKDFTDQARAKE